MPTATITPETQQRLRLQGKRIRMARAAMDVSRNDLAKLVSRAYGQQISHELLRRIEDGERDVEYALLRAIASVVGPFVTEETSTPLGWLAGGGEPVFANPGLLKARWHQFVIPWDDGEPEVLRIAS